MFRRKARKLFSKKEIDQLWAWWWASTLDVTDRLKEQDIAEADPRAFTQYGIDACDIVDEFYDAIDWLTAL